MDAETDFPLGNTDLQEALRREVADLDERLGELEEKEARVLTVGNQQKWDTLVKERSGRNGSVVGLPEQVVVALSSG